MFPFIHFFRRTIAAKLNKPDMSNHPAAGTGTAEILVKTAIGFKPLQALSGYQFN